MVFHLDKGPNQLINPIFLIGYFQKCIKLTKLSLLVYWRAHWFLVMIVFVFLGRSPLFLLYGEVVLSTFLMVAWGLVVEILLGSQAGVGRRAHQVGKIHLAINFLAAYLYCTWRVLRSPFTLWTNCLDSIGTNHLNNQEQTSKTLLYT